MGRKKKKASKPWCWYCNREFDDEKILIQHQKAKHFKCHICHKKLYTGPGLSIHCMQVHKEAIDKVPNSLSNRSNIEIEIYGMEGIPPEDIKEHEKQRAGGAGGGRDDDSDDDEPAVKKKTMPGAVGTSNGAGGGLLPSPSLAGTSAPPAPSISSMPGMFPVPPGVPLMGPMPPPPFLQGPPGMVMGGVRPLFPSGTPQTSSSAPAPPKPAFPAYSNVTISAPPTGAGGGAVGSPARPLVTSTGASSRIMHPPEDVSLEEIKARSPRYRRTTPTATVPAATVAAPQTAPVLPQPAPHPGPTLQQALAEKWSSLHPHPALLQHLHHQQQQQQQHQQQQQQMAVQLAVVAQKQAQDAHAALLRSLPRPPTHPQFMPVGMPMAAMGHHPHPHHPHHQLQQLVGMGSRQLPPGMHMMQQVAVPQLNMLRPPSMPHGFPPGMIQLGGMMAPMQPMGPMAFPGAVGGLHMMPPRFR